MFCSNQIICIDLDNRRLFAEVIQMIPDRDRLWARPLALAEQEQYNLRLLHDLREAPQLILPPALFRAALDTEVIPIITELFQLEILTKPDVVGYQVLNIFIDSLFHANQCSTIILNKSAD